MHLILIGFHDTALVEPYCKDKEESKLICFSGIHYSRLEELSPFLGIENFKMIKGKN